MLPARKGETFAYPRPPPKKKKPTVRGGGEVTYGVRDTSPPGRHHASLQTFPNLQEIPESAFESLAPRVCTHQGEKLLRVWKGMQLGRNLLPPEIHIKAGEAGE